MKIVYCFNSIQAVGGIATAVITKANALAEKGHEVFIAVSDHNPAIPVDISDKVVVKDLKVKYYEDDWKSKINVLKGIFIKRRAHKERLTQFLNQVEPDIVISAGQCEKYFLPEIKGKWKTVREFHYDKSYRLRRANSIPQKISAYIVNIYDYRFKIKRYDKIVVLTDADKKINWANNADVIVIPNPVSDECFKPLWSDSKNIIAVGRLVWQKNFSSLINAFGLVVNEHPDWNLYIYGDGELKTRLQEHIDEHGLSGNVFLQGQSSDITGVMNQSSIFVLSSLYEGMPMAMLEAMACGLPVVSYDCPYGPGDLIKDGENGYLVPLNDEVMMARKICELIENPDKRKEMGRKALLSAEPYKCDVICSKWIDLFERLSNE